MRKNGKTVLIAAFILFDLAGRLQASDEATIQSARKEGSLVVYTSMTVDQAQKLNDAFRSKYPFLQINMFRAVGERLLTKIMTEAQAGKFDFDIVQSAETQAYFLKKRNLLGRYLSPELKNIQRGFFDAEGYWSAVYMMPNVEVSAYRHQREGAPPQRRQAVRRFHPVGGRAEDHRLLRPRADAPRRADHSARPGQSQFCHR